MTSPMPSSKFVFNPHATDNEFVTERRKEAEKLEALVNDLQNRVTIANQNLFTQLIMWFPADTSPKDIAILGKALQKYAEIKPRIDTLSKELGVIDSAKANPDLLALAFADSESFERELESFTFDETV